MVDELKNFRKRIDKIDEKICKLLEERFNLCKKIGIYKKRKGLSIGDKNREKEIIEFKMGWNGLSKEFVKRFFKLIFDESKKIQREIK